MTLPAHAPDAIHDAALLEVSRWQRTPRTVAVRLLHPDGRLFVSAGFLQPYQPGAKWDWIVDTVAREYALDLDQIGCVETDQGDAVTIDGVVSLYLG